MGSYSNSNANNVQNAHNVNSNGNLNNNTKASSQLRVRAVSAFLIETEYAITKIDRKYRYDIH